MLPEERVRLIRLLKTTRFRFAGEAELQDGIEKLFKDNGFAYLREHRLNNRDRIDFLVGDVGVEVKVASASSVVERQLRRYVESDEVSCLVLVTTRSSHMGLHGLDKPLYVAHLLMSAL